MSWPVVLPGDAGGKAGGCLIDVLPEEVAEEAESGHQLEDGWEIDVDGPWSDALG